MPCLLISHHPSPSSPRNLSERQEAGRGSESMIQPLPSSPSRRINPRNDRRSQRFAPEIPRGIYLADGVRKLAETSIKLQFIHFSSAMHLYIVSLIKVLRRMEEASKRPRPPKYSSIGICSHMFALNCIHHYLLKSMEGFRCI